MNFKKITALFLALILTAALAACTAEGPKNTSSGTVSGSVSQTETSTEPTTSDPVEMRVLALSGPTGLGMAKLMDDAAKETAANKYTFEVFDAPEVLLPEVTSGNFAVAAVPTNVAARLYKVTQGAVSVLAINTRGVLYMLQIGTDTVKSVADLKGKTIYTTGQGSTPEYALNYILTENGLNPASDVTVVYETTADEVVAHAAEGVVMMLPEPKVTAVKAQVQNVNVVLDMSAEWDKVSDTPMVQGCVVVNNTFAQEHPAAVASFLREYEASIQYVIANPADASVMVETYGIMPKAAVAAKAIPNANLTFIAGADMKATLKAFYQVLFDADPTSVGGALPDDAFYYEAK